MKKLLICGDSFSCHEKFSWAHKFSEIYNTTNLSAAGSSEYRIWKKVSNAKLTEVDKIIICHTSPYRIYTENFRFKYSNGRYSECDLIYSDVENKSTPESKMISWFFENVFSLDQAKLNHFLLVENCIKATPDALHITFFDVNIPGVINLNQYWKKYPGTINHLSPAGNDLIFDILKNTIL